MPGSDKPKKAPLKVNCWEHKKCGRQLGGDRVSELGVCPAFIEKRLNGIHGGLNGGRCCYVIAGTFCEGKVQGVYAQKLSSCRDCDFYKLLMSEEGSAKKSPVEISAILRGSKESGIR